MAASATRSLLRATHSIPRPTFVRPTVTPRFATPSTSTASALRSSSSRQSSRGYSTGPQTSSSSSNNTLLYSLIGATLVAGGGYYAYTQSSDETKAGAGSKSGAVKNAAQKVDYQKVYNAVAEILEEDAEHYDGELTTLLLFFDSVLLCRYTKLTVYVGRSRSRPRCSRSNTNEQTDHTDRSCSVSPGTAPEPTTRRQDPVDPTAPP